MTRRGPDCSSPWLLIGLFLIAGLLCALAVLSRPAHAAGTPQKDKSLTGVVGQIEQDWKDTARRCFLIGAAVERVRASGPLPPGAEKAIEDSRRACFLQPGDQ